MYNVSLSKGFYKEMPNINYKKKTGVNAFQFSNKKMLKTASLLKSKEGLHVLPASTAGLIGLMELHNQEGLEPDRYVAILTGKK